MADFNVRSDSVNVEQIMEQIRGRIREKRGVDYTEQQIQELATAQLEKFLDPQQVRSNLLEEFRRMKSAGDAAEPPTLAEADDTALFETHRGWLRLVRRLLRPILKLFINTKGLATLTLHTQAETARRSRDQLLFEVMHNLVVETTRLGIEVKNLKMRLESISGRLDFNERRARALEGVVMYQPSKSDFVAPDRGPAPAAALGSSAPSSAADPSYDRTNESGSSAGGPGEGPGQRSRRRRRRRGRRGGGGPPTGYGQPPHVAGPDRGSDPAAVREVPPEPPATAPDHAAESESDQGGSDFDPQ